VQYELFQCRVKGCWVCGDRSAGDRDLRGLGDGFADLFFLLWLPGGFWANVRF
jgi:hypothetical protein